MASSRSIRTSIRRLLALPGGDRRLLLRTLPLVAAVRVALWVAPFRHVRAGLERLARSRPPRPRPAAEVDRIGWAVRQVSRLVPDASCLTQALAADLLLRRAGFPAEVSIGVERRGTAGFRAHAWVDVDGQIVIGDHDRSSFTPLRAPDRASHADRT